MRRLCILGILAVFFAGFIFSAARMEQLRANGPNLLLPLAPVDPRALLMGDYMVLDYADNSAILSAWRKTPEAALAFEGPGGLWSGQLNGLAASGKAVMRLTRDGAGDGDMPPPRAAFARLDDGTPLADDEVLVAFKVRNHRVVTAAPAYYFEEGTGSLYARAAFGRVAVNRDGKTLLLALCDAKGRDITPARASEMEKDR